jgi:formylglycine-generating enzyme required for sulfatase activity
MALALAFLAAPMATPAAEMRIESLDATGRITFSRIPTGQAYRVECATSLTGAWTRVTNAVTVDGIPTTMDCIPAKAGGLVTGSVPVEASAMFFRAVAETSDMAFIPAGLFVMGATTNMGHHESRIDETPQHIVYVSAFYMDRYEVTKALWDKVCAWAATNGYALMVAEGNSSNHPARAMTYSHCLRWCNARSEMEGLAPCYTNANGTLYKTEELPPRPGCNWDANGYRLPTDAEWEKAARGGVSGHRFAWSDTDTIQYGRGNYYASTNHAAYPYETSTKEGRPPAANPDTSPVGSFAPNGYGIYDTEGNLEECCWDYYSESYYSVSPTIDPRGPLLPSGNNEYTSRGGYYKSYSFQARVAAKDSEAVGSRYDHRGFRVARTFVNTALNHSPVIAEGGSVNVTMSEDGAPIAFGLTLHATDADGDSIMWAVATQASHGTASTAGEGASKTIDYTSVADYCGGDNFVVQVFDGLGGTDSIAVNVTIQPVNDAPVAHAQFVSVATNTPRAITLTGSDIEGSGLTYAVVGAPTHGSLSGDAPNVTYTPFLDYKGPDSFTFKANDGTTDGVPATVTLWVNSMAASGGTMTNYTVNGTNYTAHIFTTVGNSTLAVSAGGVARVLVVAGGGGGGGSAGSGIGGGGGAGGLIYTNLVLAAGNQPVTVGAGGLGGGFYSDTATKGSNSVLASLTALGGGCGRLNTNGTAGGSGAGGYGNGSAGGAANQPGGYANSGGMGGEKPGGGGGGGGAWSAGSAGVTNSVGGAGGAGLSYDISGVLTGYAGGGGGGGQAGGGGAVTDGGGRGGSASGYGGLAGLPNTGGGGGGGSSGGAGGSGIVIVRYGIQMP